MFRPDPTPRAGPRFRYRLGEDPDDSPRSDDERIDDPQVWADIPPLISDSDSDSERGDPPLIIDRSDDSDSEEYDSQTPTVIMTPSDDEYDEDQVPIIDDMDDSIRISALVLSYPRSYDGYVELISSPAAPAMRNSDVVQEETKDNSSIHHLYDE